VLCCEPEPLTDRLAEEGGEDQFGAVVEVEIAARIVTLPESKEPFVVLIEATIDWVFV